jgi:hypothetical protein
VSLVIIVVATMAAVDAGWCHTSGHPLAAAGTMIFR